MIDSVSFFFFKHLLYVKVFTFHKSCWYAVSISVLFGGRLLLQNCNDFEFYQNTVKKKEKKNFFLTKIFFKNKNDNIQKPKQIAQLKPNIFKRFVLFLFIHQFFQPSFQFVKRSLPPYTRM